MVACYGLGESELTAGMVVARNGGVATPFYRARRGGRGKVEEREVVGWRVGLECCSVLREARQRGGRWFRRGIGGGSIRQF
jgi:hypothetical protein